MIKKVNLLVIGRNFFSSSRAKWGLEMKQIESRQKALSPTRLMPLILFITAILALAMSGVAVAKKCDNPPCGGGDGDSSPYYHVTVIWPSPYPEVGGGGSYWTASNKGGVGYAPFNPDFIPSPDGTTGVLNLDFFRDYFDNGVECFPNTGGTSTVDLLTAGVSYKKSRGAQARFWFEGHTHTLVPGKKVLYLLSFFKGSLDRNKDWPPASLKNTMTWGESVASSEWELSLANEGAEIKANSCVRERGKFIDDPEGTWNGPVSIDVLPVPPP